MFLFFGAFLGGWASLGVIGPILLIFLGAWLLLRNLFGGRGRKSREETAQAVKQPAPLPEQDDPSSKA
jgi:hypothetical protein